MLWVFHLLRIFRMILKLLAEVADGTGYRPCRRICQRTNRIPFNFLCHIHEQVDVSQMPVAVFEAVQYFFHPSCPLPAWAALAAGFVVIESGEIPQVSHDACAFIKDNKSTRAQ